MRRCWNRLLDIIRQLRDSGTAVVFISHKLREVMAVADRVLETFQRPFMLGMHEVHASASCGVSMFPDDTGDLQVMASNADAERLLRSGELVGVWPEGFKGIGKPFSERYKLQRFGRGGFVSAALAAQVPIIPCSIVGAEEIYPVLGNAKTLARLLGLPYLPITPTFPWLGLLGLVPLPSKWIIEFGAPIDTTTRAASVVLDPADEADVDVTDDPMVIFDLTDQVRETIQQTLYALLMQRRSVFF